MSSQIDVPLQGSVSSNTLFIIKTPRFEVDWEKVKTLEEMIEVLKKAQFVVSLSDDQIDGIEHLVTARPESFEPQEIVKFRKKGVKFEPTPEKQFSWQTNTSLVHS